MSFPAGHHPSVEKRTFRVLTLLWFLLPVVAVSFKLWIGPSAYNNYLIYKHVFLHVVERSDLYAFHPEDHLYQNHYGPSFSLLIAPFALLPDFTGAILWVMFGAATLYLAIRRLPVSDAARAVLMGIIIVEMTGSLQNFQFNTMLCAWLILSWVWLREGRVWPAALLISGGMLVKLYGILGILFTPFSGRYGRMLVAMSMSTLLLAALPMILSDPVHIFGSYEGWYHRLVGKNAENIGTNLTDGMQDLSAMGMFRRITGWYHVSNLWFLIPAGLLMLLPLARTERWHDPGFQMRYLAQLLIGLVVFSTSAESPTYVIAVTGFAIWFIQYLPRPSTLAWVLLFAVIILTILSPTDIFPRTFRKAFVSRYGLKALPCVAAWFVITRELLSGRYPKTEPPHAHPGTAARS
ncbi:MAG: DUF2029 domain-containing protein [Chitinophagaceae bacterium]|jgi:hypothetical protein|nr:DUF2029 domain-containing protein [Chitinophagaceae bacterium]